MQEDIKGQGVRMSREIFAGATFATIKERAVNGRAAMDPTKATSTGKAGACEEVARRRERLMVAFSEMERVLLPDDRPLTESEIKVARAPLVAESN